MAESLAEIWLEAVLGRKPAHFVDAAPRVLSTRPLGAGAPEINLTALQRCERLLRPSLPIPRASGEEPTVDVVVGASVLQLPERALGVGVSILRAASGEHVRLLDYADSVGPFLKALEHLGLIKIVSRVPPEVRSKS